MVEPTQNRSDSDPTIAGLRLQNRCPQAEAAVRPIVVVAVDKLGQDPAELTLAEGNQMVEALPADCPDPPFRNRVRAGRVDRCPQALDSQPGLRRLKSPPQTRSRSWIRNRGLRSQGVASISCLQTQAAVGWAVTSKWTSWRLP
jgi:hypothetical protein